LNRNIVVSREFVVFAIIYNVRAAPFYLRRSSNPRHRDRIADHAGAKPPSVARGITDRPLALAALGGSVAIRGPEGERALPVDRLIRAAFMTELGAGEIITAILVPKLSPAGRFGYVKFCRKTGEFPEASAADVLDPASRIARIFLGDAHGNPIALPALAREAAERGPAAATREVALAAVASVPELDEAERRMHGAVLLRALQQVFGP
jgi:carbon-monoxide dehydrogenase medium subunit